MIHVFKRIVNRLYLLYLDKSPIDKGKYFLGFLLSKFFGDAKYVINGLTLYLNPIGLIERKLIENKSHDDIVISHINSLHPGDIFIDVGSNFGYFSLIASRKQIRVFAFEPSPRELNKLHLHIIKNNCHNIVIFPVALGEREETVLVNIAYRGNPGMNSILRLPTYIDKQIPVPKVRFDQLFSAKVYSEISLCKIDVEGFEVEVLQGFEHSIQKMIKCIFIVEITESFLKISKKSSKDIYAFFEKHGYKSEFGINYSLQYDEVFRRA